MKGRPRFSGVTMLAAAVLVLLPALAWLQYSWLDQIAEADRERRGRTLHTAASQLAQDLDTELAKAVIDLQLEPHIVEGQAWSAYAQRYQLWEANALAPQILKAVYFVEASTDESISVEPPLRRWNTSTNRMEETPWPEELAGLRARFAHDTRTFVELHFTGPQRGDRGGRAAQRMFVPPTPAGDEQSVIVPVMRVSAGLAGGGVAPAPPEFKLLGFQIIRFDHAALGKELLPALVQRHLHNDDGRTDFLVAIVSREDPTRVVFESQEGAASAALSNPDVSLPLLGPRPGPLMLMARDGRRGMRLEGGRDGFNGRRPPPPPAPPVASDVTEGRVIVDVIESRRNQDGTMIQRRAVGGGDAQWRLVAKHRAGSLEAAVAAARTRNFALSSGILLLLTAAIGLIVVSARRADRLARQQLEFVAAVSHELRTPVSVIGTAAGNLADGVIEEPARVKKYGATIQTEARRLGETVERVLQLAGIASGRTSARTSIPIADLVRDAVAASQHEITLAGATVEVDVSPELLNLPTDPTGVQRAVGDPAALRSAIQNLITNAIKYGGPQPWVRVSAKSMGHHATRITVEDRGLGISAEDRKHVFEPFYRGREAVSRQIQGSGLGLHLVRRIIEAHGGTVSVHSELGQGSTFTIDLPGVHDVLIRRTRHAAPGTRHPAPHEAPGTGHPAPGTRH